MGTYIRFSGADYYPEGGASDGSGVFVGEEAEALEWARSLEDGSSWKHLAVVEGDNLRIVKEWWRSYDFETRGMLPWKEGDPGPYS